MQGISAKLDWKRMLGFEQVDRLSARNAGRMGAKVGGKVGGKIGTKRGIKR